MKRIAILGPVLLMLLLAWTPGISFTEDLGRHLLLGRIILEQHRVPDTNYLTYTHPEFPFVNHHWLSEVIFYLLHRRIGLVGLIGLKMLMMAGALALAMIAVPPKRLSAVCWFTGVLAAIMMGFRAHIRPELFTYLFIAFYLWLFEQIRNGKAWARWAILPVAWFWANAQIYFVFGLGMVFCFVLERALGNVQRSTLNAQRSTNDIHPSAINHQPSTILREAAWLLAVIVVTCIGPNGIHRLLYPFTIFRNYAIGITENASPLEYWRSVLNPMLMALPFMTMLVLATVAVVVYRHVSSGRQEPLRLANLLVALAALIATWKMARSAPLLALAALPVVAAGGESSRFNVQRSTFEVGARWIATALVAALNLWLCHAVVTGAYTRPWPSPIGPTPFGFDDESRYRQLTRLKEEYGLKGPVFTDYNIGSLVEYELYPEPGYVDNRPEAFPGAFWRTEYERALALTEEWERVQQERDINAIIVSLHGVKEAFCQELMRRPLWVLVHVDSITAVWVRNHVRNKQIIDALFFDQGRRDAYERDISERLVALLDVPWWRRQVEADRLVYRLYSLVCIGEGGRIWPYLRQLHLLYPDYQIVHELMRVTVPAEDAGLVDAVMERRAHWPLAAKQVLDWGHLLMARGELQRAKEVFTRGRRFFPLSPAIRATSTAIDDQLYRGERL